MNTRSDARQRNMSRKISFIICLDMSHNTKGLILRSQGIMTATLTRPTHNVLILGHLVAKSGTTCRKLQRGLTPLHEGTFRPCISLTDVAVRVLGSWPELTPRDRIPRPACGLPSCFFKARQLDSVVILAGISKPSICIFYLSSPKLRGLSPRANYTDRAAAAGRRS